MKKTARDTNEEAKSVIKDVAFLKEGQSEQAKILKRQVEVLDLLKVKSFDNELLLRQVE